MEEIQPFSAISFTGLTILTALFQGTQQFARSFVERHSRALLMCIGLRHKTSRIAGFPERERLKHRVQ